MEDAKPRYKHNCEYCKFIGLHNEYDMYFCNEYNSPELGLRNGNDDEINTHYCKARFLSKEYPNISFINDPENKDLIPIFNIALQKAILYDLIKPCEIYPHYDDIPHYSNAEKSTLTQYLKDKKGRRCGVIQAIRIDPNYFNYYVIDDNENKITEPFVVIAHSKVRKNCGDRFNDYEAINILQSKIDYVNDVIALKTKRRTKNIYQKLVKDTLKLYEQMKKRAVVYFKTDKIYMYHDCFDYIKEDENDNYSELLAIVKNENINMNNLKLLLEGLVEDVESV